jgi:hypothetical protein
MDDNEEAFDAIRHFAYSQRAVFDNVMDFRHQVFCWAYWWNAYHHYPDDDVLEVIDRVVHWVWTEYHPPKNPRPKQAKDPNDMTFDELKRHLGMAPIKVEQLSDDELWSLIG